MVQKPSSRTRQLSWALGVAWLPHASLRPGFWATWRRKQTLNFSTFSYGLLFCLAADAFFKAATSLVPEVPKMINIDGKMRLRIIPSGISLQFLFYINSSGNAFQKTCRWCLSFWPVLYTFFALEVQGCSIYIFVGFVVRYLNFSMHLYSSVSRVYSQGSLMTKGGTTCSGLKPLDQNT